MQVDISAITKGEDVTGPVKEAFVLSESQDSQGGGPSVKALLNSAFVGNLEKSIGGMVPRCQLCGGKFEAKDEILKTGISQVHSECARAGKAARSLTSTVKEACAGVEKVLTFRLSDDDVDKVISFILDRVSDEPVSETNAEAVFEYTYDIERNKKREVNAKVLARIFKFINSLNCKKNSQ